MAKPKLPYTKQKLVLYFDENFPALAIDHFRTSSYWRKKIKIVSATESGNKGRDDKFHFNYCVRNAYILVSLDNDFCDDERYPFSFGRMPGLIIVKASRGDLRRIMVVLSRVLTFIHYFLFPKDLLRETKFICSEEGVVMRGRVIGSREISSLYIGPRTNVQVVREHFNYMMS